MTLETQGSIIEIGGVAQRPALNGETLIDLDVLKDALDYLRPALQADGGDVLLSGVNGGTVNLELVGACGGCPISETTVTAGIERILRDRVPGVVDVVAHG